MKFHERFLPSGASYVSLDEVPEDARDILGIYNAINGQDGVDCASDINQLLDEFEDQHCYVVEADEDDIEDDDSPVLAVANYRKEYRAGYAWLEGLAVRPQDRKLGLVGRFALRNLVEVTRESGLSEIRLRSVPSAVSFYQRNGFVVLDEECANGDAKMSHEIR